jgi:hypothetical protein
VEAVTDRARFPFALVGVVLLVGSATLTATVVPEHAGRTTDVDTAVERATAETVTALRGAAGEAATETAASPVLRPANTTVGRALNDSQPFRDALRLRLYLALRGRLGGVEVTRGATTVTASLPPVEPSTEGYRAAIERVEIERAGDDGAALRVGVDNLTLRVAREGRPDVTARRSPTVVVANPALLLHDRTERFERRANAPVTREGLGRRLTARLYPVVWARGYAQHGGGPISTVLGTRHVEFATNDALIAEQRAVFGVADPDGNRGVTAAGRRVATTDLLASVGAGDEWTDTVLSTPGRTRDNPSARRPGEIGDDGDRAPEITVGVNDSADHAFARFVGVVGDDELADRLERAHTVEARLRATAEQRGTSREVADPPGAAWTLLEARTDHRIELTETGGSVPSKPGWSARRTAVFEATETETTTRTWQRDNETTTTESVLQRRYRVRVTALARTKPIAGVPRGRLDGALSRATARATERALAAAGGLRGAARRAVEGETTETTATATAALAVDRNAVLGELRGLRAEARNRSVTLPAPAVGAGRANPPARLRDQLSALRAERRGDADGSAAERAVLAAELGYLDAVSSRLARHADHQAATNDEIGAAIGSYLQKDRLAAALAAHRGAGRPEADRPADPAGNLSVAVETAPGYLPTSPVDRDRLAARGNGSVHPLATRNVNVFSSPHGQVATAIFDRIPLLGTGRVSLSTAAETLAVAEDAPGVEGDTLEREVESAVSHVREELVAVMIEAGVTESDAREALTAGEPTAEEALLLANGTTIERAAAAADGDQQRRRLRLAVALESALSDPAARPRVEAVSETADDAREAYREKLQAALESELEARTRRARQRALGEKLGAVPAGLPVAPVPGSWYATANVWYVDVGGTYERFAVRGNRGGPQGAVTYRRDGRSAHLEHAGERRRLGAAPRVSFRTQTAVVVVVPAGPRGVGDTDGTLDERSPGWPPGGDDSTPNAT